MTTLQKLEQIIIRDGLDSRSRKRPLVYKKMFVAYFMRKNGMKLTYITQCLNLKCHASVIHLIRQHETFIQTKDKFYNHLIEPYRIELSGIVKKPRILVDEILECNSIKELEVIKHLIRVGGYQNI